MGLLLALAGWTGRNHRWVCGDGQCNVPCWYGLTPNRTTLSEAAGILKSLPIVNGQSVKTISFANPPEIDVGWDFTGDTIGYGYLYFDANNSLERIKIVPDGLSLGAVVDFWGNPSSVWAVYHHDPSGLYYFLTIFYPERGLSVETIGHQLSQSRLRMAAFDAGHFAEEFRHLLVLLMRGDPVVQECGIHFGAKALDA